MISFSEGSAHVLFRPEYKVEEKRKLKIKFNHFILFASLLLSVLLGPNHASAQQKYTANTITADGLGNIPAATINDIAWLKGYWHGEATIGKFTVAWDGPLSQAMMGMFKLVNDGNIIFYELLTVVEDSNSLLLNLKHFHADLTGWEEKDEVQSFPLVKLTQNAAFFDGLTFQKINDDTIHVFVAIEQHDDSVKEIEFVYHRRNM